MVFYEGLISTYFFLSYKAYLFENIITMFSSNVFIFSVICPDFRSG